MIVVDFISFLRSAVVVGVEQRRAIEAEIPVADYASAHVCARRGAELAFLMHDVNKGVPDSNLAGANAFDGQLQFLLIVEVRVPLVTGTCAPASGSMVR